MNDRLLALGCRFCPFCVLARLWKTSWFAKKLREMEKDCPACKAYQKLYGRKRAKDQ